MEMFGPETIDLYAIAEDEPFVGGRFALDSLDAIHFSILVEDRFGVVIPGAESRRAFASVGSLADFIYTTVLADPVVQDRKEVRSVA